MTPKSLLGLILTFVVVLAGWDSFYIVTQIERAVVLRFGQLVEPDVQPGLHIKAPLIDKVIKFDARLLTLDAPPERFLTQEKKALIVDSYVKWRIKDVGKFYRSTAGSVLQANRLLSQRVESGLRNRVGRLSLQEVVSGKRDELMEELTKVLNTFTEENYGIRVNDLRVKRIDLPPQVSDSVFERMATEREKEAQELRSQGNEQAEITRATADRERRVLLAEAYREAEKTRGEGDAKAAAIYASAYNQDPEFYAFYRSLQAYKASFKDSNGMMILEPDSDFFKYLKNSDRQPATPVGSSD